LQRARTLYKLRAFMIYEILDISDVFANPIIFLDYIPFIILWDLTFNDQ